MLHKDTHVLHKHSCNGRILGKSNSYLNNCPLSCSPDLGERALGVLLVLRRDLGLDANSEANEPGGISAADLADNLQRQLYPPDVRLPNSGVLNEVVSFDGVNRITNANASRECAGYQDEVGKEIRSPTYLLFKANARSPNFATGISLVRTKAQFANVYKSRVFPNRLVGS